jgi:hypothetical protein
MPTAPTSPTASSETTSLSGRDAPPLNALVALWITLLFFGWGALSLPTLNPTLASSFGVLPAGSTIGPDRGLFMSASLLTLTGFEQGFARTADLNWRGWTIVATLTAAGSLVWTTLAGACVSRIAGLGFRWTSILLTNAAMLGAAAVLGAGISRDESWAGVMGGALDALGAMAGSGLFVTPTTTSSPHLHLLWAPLGVVGVLGPVVVLDVLRRFTGGRTISRFSWLAMGGVAASFLVGMLIFVVQLMPAGHLALSDPGRYQAERSTAIVNASAAATNVRSPGQFVTSPGDWPRPAQWLAVPLMMLGGVAGGSGTGVGVLSVAVLAWGLWRSWTGAAPGRVFAAALLWTAAYVVAFFLTLLGMITTQPQMPGDRCVLLAASALSNVGLSPDPVSTTGNGLLVLTLAMLFGRLGLLWVLWSAAGFESADD